MFTCCSCAAEALERKDEWTRSEKRCEKTGKYKDNAKHDKNNVHNYVVMSAKKLKNSCSIEQFFSQNRKLKFTV